MVNVLVTNGGPHPPEKWAVATAEHIFPIDGVKDSDRLLAAKKLQIAIAEALAPHHGNVQTAEKGKLSLNGDAQLDAPITPEDHIDDAVSAIHAAAQGTPWEAHFADPAVVAVIRQEIGSHFATAQHIERQWHARRSKNPAAKAWLDRHHAETGV